MKITLRDGIPADAESCGRIIYSAFTKIAETHAFPSDFPSPEAGVALANMLLAHPSFYGVVAEREGRVIGSNFLDERSSLVGLGPITVAPDEQNGGAGRLLMEHALERCRTRGYPGVRLLQAAYHNRSLALYASLGFEVREICAAVQGRQAQSNSTVDVVRTATVDDVDECNRLCIRVHGHDRAGDLRDSISQGHAMLVERSGRVTGYTTGISYFGHTIGESNEDLKALIAASPQYAGPGLILPLRNTELLRWCLENRLRIVHNLNLMTIGLYNEPRGAYLPSILM